MQKTDSLLGSIFFMRLREYIRNIKHLPRWSILLIDTFLSVLSCVLTYFLLLDLNISPSNYLSLWAQLLIVVSVNVVYFLVFRIYAGLIRHSSYVDALKIILSSGSTFITLVGVDFFIQRITGVNLFLEAGLLLYLFVSFTALFLFRLTVKQVFELFKPSHSAGNLINAVLLGIDDGAISVASALGMESPQRFKVRGFLSTNEGKRLRILGKPVFNIDEQMIDSLKAVNIQAVIFAGNTFTAESKFKIVEECLENDIKVFNSPLVINWSEKTTMTNQLKSLQIEDLLEREPIVLNKKTKLRQIRDKTVLVTGGAGSIGSEIVRQLSGFEPDRIIVLDQAETPLHNLSLELRASFPDVKYDFVICDVANRNRLGILFKKYTIDIIYHAAAYKHVPLMEANPSEAVVTNIYGTKNLADLACIYKVSHFVMVSTDKAVNPTNVMGATKRAAELYVQSRFFAEHCKDDKVCTKFITTRFGNVLGSNGSVVPLFKKQISQGGPVTITHPDIIRYFMTIPEACQLVLEAGAMGTGGEIFIFDMGKPIRIMDLAEKMIKLAGYEPNGEIEIKITGLRPGEKLFEELLSDNSKTMPTHHEKIMISKDMNVDFDFISDSVNKIIKNAISFKDAKTVGSLKKLIPEYRSQNSEFEILDME